MSNQPADLQMSKKAWVRDVLQSVEDALLRAGYDDFVVATESGMWRWQTVEHARKEARGD